jgi:hypothetical protein
MLEDMAMRGLRQDTQRDYVRFVRSFAAFLKRPPDTATPEDIRRFQVHQAESGVQPQSINCSVSALRFFFTVTLDRPDLSRRFVASATSSPTVQMTAKSACPPSSHRVNCAPACRPLHPAPLPSNALQPPRHLRACIEIFKSP